MGVTGAAGHRRVGRTVVGVAVPWGEHSRRVEYSRLLEGQMFEHSRLLGWGREHSHLCALLVTAEGAIVVWVGVWDRHSGVQ